MPLINSKLPDIKITQPKRRKGPVWDGPCSDGKNGGITYSLLCRFLSCRERFRLLVVEGLKAAEGFSHRLEYGNMWHVCEERFAQGGVWAMSLHEHCLKLCKKYPLEQEKVQHWYEVCKAQFPVYIEHWQNHQDVKLGTPILQEEVFCVPYQLPSGRVVYLRGKWDRVDLLKIPKTKSIDVILQEDKTKGDVDRIALERQLTFDLQTMLYMIALHESRYTKPLLDLIPKGAVIRGVRYNVVRRPLSGGKGTIVQHKPSKKNPRGETGEEYYARLQQVFRDDPDNFFMRWNSEVSQTDIQIFKDICLTPMLENLCYWWDWVNDRATPIASPYAANMWHWRHPYGVWNPLDDGRFADVDGYLATKSEAGLQRTDNLFPELSA